MDQSERAKYPALVALWNYWRTCGRCPEMGELLSTLEVEIQIHLEAEHNNWEDSFSCPETAI